MPQDRRDNSPILDKLEVMQVNLALNTKDTSNILEQLKTLNGKVVAHESRIQTQEGTLALTVEAVAQIKKEKKDEDDKQGQKRSAFLSKAGWAIAGGVLVLAGRVISYLEQIDFFKHIIK